LNSALNHLFNRLIARQISSSLRRKADVWSRRRAERCSLRPMPRGSTGCTAARWSRAPHDSRADAPALLRKARDCFRRGLRAETAFASDEASHARPAWSL